MTACVHKVICCAGFHVGSTIDLLMSWLRCGWLCLSVCFPSRFTSCRGVLVLSRWARVCGGGGLLSPHIPLRAFLSGKANKKYSQPTLYPLSTIRPQWNDREVPHTWYTIYGRFLLLVSLHSTNTSTEYRLAEGWDFHLKLTFRKYVKKMCYFWSAYRQTTLGGTHSLSSSFMSSKAPRSITVIWFSISCLWKEDRKRALETTWYSVALTFLWVCRRSLSL